MHLSRFRLGRLSVRMRQERDTFSEVILLPVGCIDGS